MAFSSNIPARGLQIVGTKTTFSPQLWYVCPVLCEPENILILIDGQVLKIWSFHLLIQISSLFCQSDDAELKSPVANLSWVWVFQGSSSLF